jgi:prolipoprotein diacylglyceryltransferase
LYGIAKSEKLKTGDLTFLYLLLAGLERFVVDFWRGDRTFFAAELAGLSVHQLLSGGIVIMALLALIVNKLVKRR